MGIGTGMRGIDLQKFLSAAKKFNVVILVRHTNADSFKYIGKPGYYPKPAVCKAKTADSNPPVRTIQYKGKPISRLYEIAGLVPVPDFHPKCYGDAKQKKAQDCWEHTLEVLAPAMRRLRADPDRPDSWATWGQERQGVHAPNWAWRVDIDPNSKHFGCLQLLKRARADWCYIHGDYDLKDVIVGTREGETHNVGKEGKLDGVKNITPVLGDGVTNIPAAYRGREFEFIKTWLNLQMGVEMVQHGAEAQFGWHGDEPITIAFPDGTHQLLYDAVTVQSLYAGVNRELKNKGFDYRADPKRILNLDAGGVGHWAG